MSPNSCLIYGVCYAGDQKSISHVMARINENGTSTPAKTYTRDEIVVKINEGYTVKTRIQVAGDSYKDGAEVGICPLNGIDYIKTVPNDIEEDNLGELPTFKL